MPTALWSPYIHRVQVTLRAFGLFLRDCDGLPSPQLARAVQAAQDQGLVGFTRDSPMMLAYQDAIQSQKVSP